MAKTPQTQQQTQTQQTSSAPDPSAQGSDKPQDDGDLQHKYDTLQGMFNAKNAEHNQLREQMREAGERTQRLEAVLATMNEKTARMDERLKQADERPREQRLTSEVLENVDEGTRKYMEAFAHDHIAPIQQRADRAVQEAGTLRQELVKSNTEQQRIMQQNQALREQIYYGTLSSRIPDWQKVNQDPAFTAWLQEADPFSGRQRQEVLNAAHTAGDADAVANIFQSFAQHSAPQVQQPQGLPGPQQSSQPSPQTQIANPGYTPRGGAPVQDLNQQIAPPRGRTTPIPANADADPNAEIWTPAMARALYDDKVAGRISLEDFKIAEGKLFEAQAQGRIQA